MALIGDYDDVSAVRSLLLAVTLAVTAAVVVASAPASGSSGDGLADLPALKPKIKCAAVRDLALDLPVTIDSAVVAGSACRVRGTIAPGGTIVVRLPVDGWTQRYIQTGCGGLCGSATIGYGQAAGCSVIRDGSVASATTDMGHQGQDDGSWAAGNPQAQIDFAYRGVHLTAQIAKALIKAFYGRAPAYSYFTGCSDGGREGLMEAQRYPEDFDGIAAGAPAINKTVQNTFHHAWSVLANEGGVLRADRLPLIHAAVLAACDKIDGLADGLIDDPRQCDFDPATLVCPARTTCLSVAEADVVRKLHDGASTTYMAALDPDLRPFASHGGKLLLWHGWNDQHIAPR